MKFEGPFKQKEIKHETDFSIYYYNNRVFVIFDVFLFLYIYIYIYIYINKTKKGDRVAISRDEMRPFYLMRKTNIH